MNRKVLFFSVIVFIAFLSTCGDSGATPDSLELSKETVELDAKQNVEILGIVSSAKWNAKCSESWLSCIPNSGDSKIVSTRVTIKENTTGAARTGTLTVTTEGGTARTMQVTQSGPDPFINTDPVSASSRPTGDDIAVEVHATGEWTAQIPDNAKSWISLSPQTSHSQAVFTVAPNETGNDRAADIIFNLNGTGLQAAFNLSQPKIIEGISIDPDKKSIEGGAADVTVKVTSDRVWKVSIPVTWVKVKQQTDSQAVFSVEANASENARTAKIDFQNTGGTVLASFELTQSGSYAGYTLMGTLEPQAAQSGLKNTAIHDWIRAFGWDYTEWPNCTGIGGYPGGTHLEVVMDAVLNKYVLRFDIHITPVITSDRCGTFDRQRNELKSATNNTTWAKMQGNWDEWQVLEWKFKIPAGFQPTNSFCHIHQLKAQDGSYNGSPVITITPRANSNGTNKRMQIIHTSEGGKGTTLGTVVDNIPLSDFEDEWVQVVEEAHYTHNGYYSVKITRIRDNKVLLSYTRDNIDMWRPGSSYIRNKFGIYRSLNGGNLQTGVPPSSLLKNESVWMCDFKIYEKNTNPNPTVPH